MSESMSDLEKDIEASRARLDETIDRIQSRLTPVNLVDEMLGSARATPLNTLYDGALDAVRKNPLPVLLIAAGIGMLLNKMSRSSATVPNPGPLVGKPSDPESGPEPMTAAGSDPRGN